MRHHISLAVFVGGMFLTAVAASAQVAVLPPADFTLSAGYSYVQTQKASNLFYDHSGSYVDADLAWQLPLAIPLRAGFGLTGSGYFERESVAAAPGDNFFPHYRLYSDLGLFEIEPRIGVRLGRETGFFAVPRLGAGLLIDTYSIDQYYNNGGNPYVYTHDHTARHSKSGLRFRRATHGGHCRPASMPPICMPGAVSVDWATMPRKAGLGRFCRSDSNLEQFSGWRSGNCGAGFQPAAGKQAGSLHHNGTST